MKIVNIKGFYDNLHIMQKKYANYEIILNKN